MSALAAEVNAALERLYQREDLVPADLERLFARLIAGELDPVLLAALLVARSARAARVIAGEIEELTLTPEQAGLKYRPLSALAGGEPGDNARALAETLAGRRTGAYAEAIALNTGALLWVAGRAETLAMGTAEAREALASGRAGQRLEHLQALTAGS